MLTIPVTLMRVIVKFTPLFSKRVWEHGLVLVVGAILAPGKRMVTAILRVMGLSEEAHFQNYHRVLNWARWSSLAGARELLELLVGTFVPVGPVVIGVDDTLERRRGAKIKAKGLYRDPVRSSRSHMVKASGLRWLCAMLLSEIPGAGRVWALPFLSALCPSERYHRQRGQRHKTLPEWAGQLIGLIQRWLPGREVVVVADSSYAVIELLKQVSATPNVSLITRLRLDAALYDPAPPRAPRQNGRPRKKGARRPTFGRTTPALFGLYSLVTLVAHALLWTEAPMVRTAAWYAKVRPTFSDALAVVRRELWSCCHFAMSESHAEMVKIPRSVLERLTDTVCYAA